MTYQRKLPWPGCTDLSAKQILGKYPQYKLIITGHNHQAFVERAAPDRVLVNPGSITRQTADQINHVPSVYLWYQDIDQEQIEIERVSLHCSSGPTVMSTQHLTQVQERDRRIEAFVQTLNQEWDATISFVANLRRFEQENNVPQAVMDVIWQSLDPSE
jgi:DNA repair exonuclease SbcCD nuclease subunit